MVYSSWEIDQPSLKDEMADGEGKTAFYEAESK